MELLLSSGHCKHSPKEFMESQVKSRHTHEGQTNSEGCLE